MDGMPTVTAFVPTAAPTATQPDGVLVANPYFGHPLREPGSSDRGGSGDSSSSGDSSGGYVV